MAFLLVIAIAWIDLILHDAPHNQALLKYAWSYFKSKRTFSLKLQARKAFKETRNVSFTVGLFTFVLFLLLFAVVFVIAFIC